MKSKWFKNYDAIATTKTRQDLLAIAEAGLDAIDTEAAIKKNVRILDNKLQVKDQIFDLAKFKSIKVIGFGKVSCTAAAVLEEVLGKQLTSGIALGVAPVACEVIKTFGGTHPEPSEHNVQISEQIMKLGQAATADDLVIVIVSGGGSALLCYPQTECDQGQILYHQFLKTGGPIEELNLIRKHLSQLKGGGLAKVLYPATVVSLIFSDVPGDDYSMVASGPTFMDRTTVDDAKTIIEKYGLSQFELTETPKDQIYFEKVANIPFVTNNDALQVMSETATKLGYKQKIVSNALYDQPTQALQKMRDCMNENDVVLAGGEPEIKVTRPDGTGGRNLYMGMQTAASFQAGENWLLLASDGADNSDCAGVIVDNTTMEHIKKANLDPVDFLNRFDGYTLFQKSGDLLFTGPTGANVSDLLIMLKIEK